MRYSSRVLGGVSNVGALIIRIGFGGFLITSVVLYTPQGPKPYSNYEGPHIIPPNYRSRIDPLKGILSGTLLSIKAPTFSCLEDALTTLAMDKA